MASSRYYIGTIPSDISRSGNGTIVAGRGSTGWVDAVFEGSSRLCDCHSVVDELAYLLQSTVCLALYSIASILDSIKLKCDCVTRYFYDSYNDNCIHPDERLAVKERCSKSADGLVNAAPSVWDYYYKALFTGVHASKHHYSTAGETCKC